MTNNVHFKKETMNTLIFTMVYILCVVNAQDQYLGISCSDDSQCGPHRCKTTVSHSNLRSSLFSGDHQKLIKYGGKTCEIITKNDFRFTTTKKVGCCVKHVGIHRFKKTETWIFIAIAVIAFSIVTFLFFCFCNYNKEDGCGKACKVSCQKTRDCCTKCTCIIGALICSLCCGEGSSSTCSGGSSQNTPTGNPTGQVVRRGEETVEV